ncbi:MAG: galactose-1-phosphate uridylyltransferase [Candidatus Rokubacteria bacterium 13_1_40CM_69_27]|nr:MAG: galactose-1-phosphate uridylyltransferase [Candidatus Rokubacteria bacterium 13_1_40CM_69_27]OLC30639.1 MAG: galactose-1-phosphate uridylyltransferase [Candidatus Rokubacteria bacterium 13_1_40CM_4_69_5]
MSELRKDPIVGRWVIIAADRARRPSDFEPEPARPRLTSCAFCAGHEDTTPPEILAGRPPGGVPNGPGWTFRVVANKFPALRIEGDLEPSGEGLFDRMNGVGAHEVVIESPEHTASLATMSVDAVADVLLAFRERVLDLKKDARFQYVLIFKNHGEAAGATLEHPHSQLIATPIIPIMVGEELAGAATYYEMKERCVWCDILRQERRSRRRLVLDADGFAALVPFAPRFPFETWILPARHRSAFEESGVDELRALAGVLRDFLGRMNRALNDPPFNFMLHSAPLQEPTPDHFHWHLEIIPKLTRVAGFEWGSGFFINPVAPEDAAAALREAGG